MGTELVPETSVNPILTSLSARENVINFNLKLVSRRKVKPFRCSTRHWTAGGRVLEVSPWRMKGKSAEVTQILGSRVIAARLEVTAPGREVYWIVIKKT